MLRILSDNTLQHWRRMTISPNYLTTSRLPPFTFTCFVITFSDISKSIGNHCENLMQTYMDNLSIARQFNAYFSQSLFALQIMLLFVDFLHIIRKILITMKYIFRDITFKILINYSTKYCVISGHLAVYRPDLSYKFDNVLFRIKRSHLTSVSSLQARLAQYLHLNSILRDISSVSQIWTGLSYVHINTIYYVISILYMQDYPIFRYKLNLMSFQSNQFIQAGLVLYMYLIIFLTQMTSFSSCMYIKTKYSVILNQLDPYIQNQ